MKKNLFAVLWAIALIVPLSAQSVMWSSILDFDSGTDEMCNDISMDESNNAYVAGYAFGASSFDALAVKYDATTGDTVWASLHDVGTSSFEIIYGSALYSQGNLFTVGYVSNGDNDAVMIKYDNATGVVLWDKTYDFGGDETGMECAINDSNEVVVALQMDAKVGYMKCKVSNGDTIKCNLIPLPNGRNARVFGLLCGEGDVIYLCGYAESTSVCFKPFVMKYDIAADSVIYFYESANYIDNLSAAINGISADSSGSVYCSFSAGDAAGTTYGGTFKLDASGAFVWERISSSEDCALYKNCMTADGYLYACGFEDTGISDDYFLVKYDAGDGSIMGDFSLPSPVSPLADDYAYAMGACEDSNVILSGVSDWDEILTFKAEVAPLAAGDSPFAAAPAPASSYEWINSVSYVAGELRQAKVVLYDAAGRLVCEKPLSESSSAESFSFLPSGMYHAFIKDGNKTVLGKLLKI